MLDQELLKNIKSKLELDRKEINKSIKFRLKNLFLDKNELTELGDHSREEMNFFDKINLGVRDVNHLRKIKSAIKRINDGSYGECDECGERIRRSRLIANPISSKCIFCQEDEESKNRGFALPISESLALA